MTTAERIRLHILEEITNRFSVDSRIGRGGYGDVYKGDYKGREIAVKLLHVDTVQGLDDQQYINEVRNLSRVKHPNIVQLLGYCYETVSELVEHNGNEVFRQHIYRVLCFEYLQGGSLDKLLCAQSFAPNWSTRYNIIKGISEGLNFLHECYPQIWHLDLKPANILLDGSMEPKVADFGLSRLFTRSHTHVTEKVIGTRKYMPPEFLEEQIISPKNDVFSLGVVMIEIMTRSPGHSCYIEMDEVAQFKQEVHTDWKNTIETTSEYPSEELHQVQTCINTAMRCVEPDRNKRPTIAEVLDILNKTETHIPKRQIADMLPCRTLSPKNTAAKRLNTMTAEVGNITNEHEHCNFMPRDSFNINVHQVPDRETSSDVEQTLIIGRTEEKQKILSILSESITEEMAILPIYGVGGIGKTTLAQLVFNDTQFQGYSRVWVYVPQKFDLNKIGNSIISQLSKESSHIADKQMLHNRLGELLSCKRILIVLDDLWEEDPYKLDKLKAMLRLGRGNKVILVTTRDEAVARKICCTVTPYKLETLTDDMCWTIIQQKSNFQNRPDKDQLKQIGKDISIKCGGVALAAQSLGYMLMDMTSDQWESARDNDIWNLSTDPSLRNQEVLASLRLSYSHMPKWLQLCFSYCAVFPKGHRIVKQDLIHQWIALGFAKPSKTFDSLQLCEKYVTQLLGLSFLEYSKAPSTHGRREKSVTLFTMHDLVHDLARAMLADKVNEKDNAVGSNCHYALLTDCSKPLQLSLSSPENTRFKIFSTPFQRKSSPENIKALFFLDCGKIKLHGGAFSAAKFLHVLDLGECCIQKLPGSIGQLKNLRYLHAPRIQDKKIPNCITKLSQLNYLNIRDSHNISALPESIGDMKGLMHLDLSGCDGIREFPVSFAELNQLVHLDLSNCCMSISEAFGGFTELQYLNLSVEFLIDRSNRRGLSKVIGNLVKLRYLNLSGCMEDMASLEDQKHSLVVSISTLPNLEHLDLSENSLLFSIPESIGNLRKLRTLDLSACRSLRKLPDSMANMVSLKVLLVDKEVTLDEPALSQSNFAPLPHFVVHASSDKCSSNISLLQHTNPEKLMIDRLENVKSVEEVQGIKLIEKQKIEELTFQWTVAAERFVDDKEVLEKLVPPSSVKKLSITGYRSIGFPDWLMGMWKYLPNLCELDLCDIHNLPPLGQLLNLKQLSLHCMGGLEEWKTTDPSASSSSLITHLSVAESKVPMHEWRLLHHLPDLCRLTINSCSDLIASPEIIQQLSSLESLHLEFSFLEQAELPRWLVELTSLQRLTLTECRSMTSLPGWLGELTHLKRIEIEDCEGIRSLPDSIQQLTKLNYLRIRGCYLLVKWCDSKDNQSKFADIIEEEDRVSWLRNWLEEDYD